MKFELVKLPYAPNALEPVISEKTIGLHHGKHLQTYVNNLNKQIEGTEFANMELVDIVKKSEGGIFNNAGQTLNHNLYFLQFAPKGSGKPSAELLKAIEEKWGSLEEFKKAFEADALYAGINIDTDGFNSKSGPRTFEAAAFLRRHGADVTRVRKLFREDMNDYKARGETIRNAELFRGQFAISECPSDYVDSPTVVGAQAANELLNIVGVKASFVLTEYKGVIYISARAIDEVNVQIIMERMGGGGHLNMAGCQLETVDLEGARSLLKSTLTEMQDGGEI